jgi:hypothetical protein
MTALEVQPPFELTVLHRSKKNCLTVAQIVMLATKHF